MGDDCHNRYVATTSLFVRQIAPYMLRSGFDAKSLEEVAIFLKGNDFTMLNLAWQRPRPWPWQETALSIAR